MISGLGWRNALDLRTVKKLRIAIKGRAIVTGVGEVGNGRSNAIHKGDGDYLASQKNSSKQVAISYINIGICGTSAQVMVGDSDAWPLTCTVVRQALLSKLSATLVVRILSCFDLSISLLL